MVSTSVQNRGGPRPWAQGKVGGALAPLGAMTHLIKLCVLVGLVASGGLVVHRADAGEPSVTITRGPYLQALLSRSVSIVWRTRTSVECRVRLQEDGAQAPMEAISPRRTNHLVKLDGLSPGRIHRYEVLDADGQPLAGGGPFEFRAAPENGEGSC